MKPIRVLNYCGAIFAKCIIESYTQWVLVAD